MGAETIQLVCIVGMCILYCYSFFEKRLDRKQKYKYDLIDKDKLIGYLESCHKTGREIVFMERVDIGKWILITRGYSA